MFYDAFLHNNRVEKIHLPYSPRGMRAAKLLISLRTPALRTPAHKKTAPCPGAALASSVKFLKIFFKYQSYRLRALTEFFHSFIIRRLGIGNRINLIGNNNINQLFHFRFARLTGQFHFMGRAITHFRFCILETVYRCLFSIGFFQ